MWGMYRSINPSNFRTFLQDFATKAYSTYVSYARYAPAYSSVSSNKLSRHANSDSMFMSTKSVKSDGTTSKKDVIGIQLPKLATSSTFVFPSWWKWIFGSVLSLFIPAFWKQKLDKLKTLEEEAEMVVEEVENVAEVVEKVASLAGKVSSDAAERLPENGKLKEAALVVKHVSEEAVHDAQVAEAFIHKVEQWKEKLDELEKQIDQRHLDGKK